MFPQRTPIRSVVGHIRDAAEETEEFTMPLSVVGHAMHPQLCCGARVRLEYAQVSAQCFANRGQRTLGTKLTTSRET
jgi:hypothetical protein